MPFLFILRSHADELVHEDGQHPRVMPRDTRAQRPDQSFILKIPYWQKLTGVAKKRSAQIFGVTFSVRSKNTRLHLPRVATGGAKENAAEIFKTVVSFPP